MRPELHAPASDHEEVNGVPVAVTARSVAVVVVGGNLKEDSDSVRVIAAH